LTPAQLEALLAVTDVTTPFGLRDRAVIVMLSRLGIRAGEAAGLTLDDIDWAGGCVKVTGKGRNLTLPLPVDVGQALVAWLQVRPVTADRSVFCRLRSPMIGLTSSGLSTIVTHRAIDAGLGVMHSHRLRHTTAMSVIAAGGSLVEAQELLGHSGVETTKVYARTDLASLRMLATPFGRMPR